MTLLSMSAVAVLGTQQLIEKPFKSFLNMFYILLFFIILFQLGVCFILNKNLSYNRIFSNISDRIQITSGYFLPVNL